MERKTVRANTSIPFSFSVPGEGSMAVKVTTRAKRRACTSTTGRTRHCLREKKKKVIRTKSQLAMIKSQVYSKKKKRKKEMKRTTTILIEMSLA